jgi:hypothetical protein
MKGLGVSVRAVGRLLLRCLVGKYGTILWTGMLALVVGAGAYLSLVYDHGGSAGADQGTVYSVAAVDAHPARDPNVWLGRTIQVRGEIVPCIVIPSVGSGPCAVLVSGSGPGEGMSQSLSMSDDTLSATRAGLDPFRTLVRRVPLLGRLAPAPQELHWGVVATYRVRLAVVPDSICGTGECVEARLLDSSP